jgi:hypothetical protein
MYEVISVWLVELYKQVCWISAMDAFFIPLIADVQTTLPEFDDSLFSTYYYQRVSLFENLPKTENDIVFIGNSITDGNESGFKEFEARLIENKNLYFHDKPFTYYSQSEMRWRL